MKRHGERGSSLPEAAIVMTLLLTMLFGIVDFGRAFYTYDLVSHLARQGARWAIVRGSQCSGLDHCPAQQGSTDIQPYVQSLSEGATDGEPNHRATDLSVVHRLVRRRNQRAGLRRPSHGILPF